RNPTAGLRRAARRNLPYPMIVAALTRRLDEGDDLHGNAHVDRRLARREHRDDLAHQLAVDEARVDRNGAYPPLREDQAAVVAPAGADAAHAGEATVAPAAGHDIGVPLVLAGDALTA